MGVCMCTKKKEVENVRMLTRDSEHALLDRFGTAQIQMLQAKFKQHEHNGGVDISGFKKIMPYISKLPNDIIENAFKIFLPSSQERISWTSFCATVSQYILGSRKEKCKFLYEVFDKKQRGMLTKDEISLLNKHLFEVLKSPITKNVNKNNLLDPCINSANVIKFEDFSNWAIANIDLHKALQPFEIIPSAVTEKEIYLKYQNEMKLKGFVEGEFYYLISKNWIEAWRNYVRFNSSEDEPIEAEMGNNRYRSTSFKSGARPIEISNSVILNPECNVKLLPNLRENIDFEILTKEAWVDFFKWYGGGPEIMREAVKVNEIVTVDIYPPILKIIFKKSENSALSKEAIFLQVNKGKKVGLAAEELKRKLNLEGDFHFILKTSEDFNRLENEKTFAEYSLGEISLCTFEIASENKDPSILLEETLKFSLEDAVEYLENGYWMSGIIRCITGTEYIIGASWHRKTIKINKTESAIMRKPPMVALSMKSIPNSTGIMNIGNTCYMNAILQCIGHSPLINQYFTGQFYADLKRKNTATVKLKVVEEVENLLKELRTSKELRIRPDRFYVEFTKVHKQFQGFEQHDSHEFLGTLLNSLHEDLKLSLSEFSQTFTLKGINADEERKKSQEQWNRYRGQCGSVISAICGGQSRNCLSCKNCSEKSTIFEVFTDFSIPIPIKEYDITFVVVVVPRFSRDIRKVLITLNKTDEFEIFLSQLQERSGISIRKLVFCYVKHGFFDKYFSPDTLEEVTVAEKGALHALEILTTVEEAEALGMLTLKRSKPDNWRKNLAVQDLVDIKVGDAWHVGIIQSITLEESIMVQVLSADPQIKLQNITSSSIQFYRQKTSSSNKILHFPLFHVKCYKNLNRFFGTPQMISIGSWYTFKDLLSLLYGTCELFVDKRVKIKKKVSFLIFKRSGKCAICDDKMCFECEMDESFESLEGFSEIFHKFYIVASWVDEFVYKQSYIEDPEGTDLCSIHDCFTKYTEPEEIEIRCESCGHGIQESQIEIWRLPDLLIIHLKRFSYKNQRLLKINHLVRFPLIGLDMSFWMLNSKKKQGVTMKTTKDNYLYDLYAVVNHTGGISGGHYTAFCKLEDGRWLFFDDERVYSVTGDPEEEIITKKAYILFYKRQRFTSGNVVKTMSLC